MGGIKHDAVGVELTQAEFEAQDSHTIETLKLEGVGAVLVISAGALTVTQSFHRIDTEGAAASDDLDTINGGTEGDILILRSTDNARDITVKNATGNIRIGADFILTSLQDTIMLIFDGTTWLGISTSNNS